MVFLRLLVAVGCLIFSFCLIAEAETPARKLVFSQIEGSPLQTRSAKMLTVLYGKLGIEVSFEILPARRALESSNSGKTDGEVFRIKSLYKRYPNLIQVPTILHTFNGYAYTMNGQIINSWEDMRPYRIGLMHGVVWAEKGTEGYNVVRLLGYRELLDKLLSGGIDIVIGTEFSFNLEVNRLGITTKFYRGKSLRSLSVYHYLHKKNASLVDQVDAEIKSMTKSGDIERISGIRHID